MLLLLLSRHLERLVTLPSAAPMGLLSKPVLGTALKQGLRGLLRISRKRSGTQKNVTTPLAPTSV